MLKKIRDSLKKHLDSSHSPEAPSAEESAIASQQIAAEPTKRNAKQHDPQAILAQAMQYAGHNTVTHIEPGAPIAEAEQVETNTPDYDCLHEPSFTDAFCITHNFVMLIRLMEKEIEKLETDQRFKSLTEDEQTHHRNKRFDFLLKLDDASHCPAYCHRYEKRIVYGLHPEVMDDKHNRHKALTALTALAKHDIAVLTEAVQKPQAPFEVIAVGKDEGLIQEIATLLA